MKILESACEYLALHDPPVPCDLIFVLAGRPERKPYGLELFRQGLAPRLILSVARFEIRHAAALLEMPSLLTLRDNLPPEDRHFWIDFQPAAEPQISLARLKKTNTFWELTALADYVHSSAAARIAMVSTSIHLRRVQYCCSKISFFASKTISFVPVPEATSSFKTDQWWTRRENRNYVLKEHAKLCAYRLIY